MRQMGILGGTFDPIHFGHLRMAYELANALKLDEVRFIPTATPPHRKQPAISSQHRAEMVRLAIADNPKFVLDQRELVRAEKDSEASYTIDTLISLRAELGEETVINLLMGSDAFLGLSIWHRWEELLDHCHIIVASRPNISLELKSIPPPLKTLLKSSELTDVNDLAVKPAGHILMQPITPLDISATRIRENIKENLAPHYLMPQAVIEYINKNQLL